MEKELKKGLVFWRTETFRHSQSISTNTPILVCDGMEERGNDVETLSLMKRDKRIWKWLWVVEWDEWRHMWMRMSGLRECEIETREWETTRRDETEIEWYKWWRERQDVHCVLIWCVWVLILWPNMECVEIDVETDTLEYHTDIDCCPVEWRTHHCVNAFSKCMFCVLSNCFHSDR